MGSCLPHATIPTHTAPWGAGKLWDREDTPPGACGLRGQNHLVPSPQIKVEAGGMGCFFLSMKMALHFYMDLIYWGKKRG